MAEDTQTVAPPQYTPSADETGALEALKTGPMKSVADPFERLYKQSQQASFENETAKRKQAETLAKGKSDAVQTMYTGMQGRMAEMDKMAPPPKMNITPDTHEGLMGLATILPIAGILLGSKGMMSGVNAMNAMTGVMKGYQEGNKARIEFEKQKYDTSMKEWDANYKISRQKLADAIEMMKTNYQAGVAKAETAAVAMGPEPAAIVRQNGAAFLLSKLDEANKHVLAAQSKLNTASAQRPIKVLDTQTGNVVYATPAQISDPDNADRYQGAPPASEQKNAAVRQMVRNELGVELGAEAPNAEKIASTMAEAGSIAKYAQDNPDVVGRSGQFRQFTDRYIQSFRSGDPSVVRDLDANDNPTIQKSLLFAKRYAKFLTDYERSVAGGSKGFTVSLQNRYNQLMSQEQFNSQSLVELMRQHAREIASGATGLSDKIKFDDLLKMGVKSRSRAGDPDVEAGATLLKGGAATSSTSTGVKAGNYKYNPETGEMEPQ